MTYLAPRQGLFAIIILVSFCLQTLLLVISTDQQLTKIRAQKGEQMIAQLIDEARLSLENKDRVSLSVIANRYSSEQDIARLLIKDNNDEILVPVGNAPMQQGETLSQIATKGDAVIGSVALTFKDISKGEIIAMQWPFVIGSLFLHLLLWLLYGYIARPTKEQINALSRDIQDLHRVQYAQAGSFNYGRQDFEPQAMANENIDNGLNNNANINNQTAASADESTAANMGDIHNELNVYLKSQQHSGDAESQSNSSSTGSEINKFVSNSSKLSAARPCDRVSVQLRFHDEYNMLERLAPEMRMPYLALCTQLLNQASTELLKQPLFLGVSVVNSPRFDDHGACAELQADNSHAKVALAGVMLAKLYLMLNKIIHDKHIELSRFALPVKAGVSDSAQVNAMNQLLTSVGKKEQMLILLPNIGLKQISNHIQIYSLKRPTTVYERECAVFDGGSDAMIQRLTDMRNSVLMTGNEDI